MIVSARRGQVAPGRQPETRARAMRRSEDVREGRWTAAETALALSISLALAAVMALL